jgi:hypothetical protein
LLVIRANQLYAPDAKRKEGVVGCEAIVQQERPTMASFENLSSSL